MENSSHTQPDSDPTDLYPLVDPNVKHVTRPSKSDLSDWVDLMEVVEALCPKWPTQPTGRYTVFKM